MHASSHKGGQHPSACISSRITTVIQVGEEQATKGTITDLISHSQFHCTGHAYLDMHGFTFVTNINYWQDQPGKAASTRSRACRWRATQRWQQAPRGEKEGRRVRQTTYFLTTRGTARLYSGVEGRGSAPPARPQPPLPRSWT